MNHTKIQVPRMAVAKANSALPPKSGARHEQQGQQDAQLGGGDGGPGGGGDELVAAQLLHDEAGHAHAHAGTENGQQTGQSGDKEDLQLLQITGKQTRQIYVNDTHKEGPCGQSQQDQEQDNGHTVSFDGKRPLNS